MIHHCWSDSSSTRGLGMPRTHKMGSIERSSDRKNGHMHHKNSASLAMRKKMIKNHVRIMFRIILDVELSPQTCQKKSYPNFVIHFHAVLVNHDDWPLISSINSSCPTSRSSMGFFAPGWLPLSRINHHCWKM